MAVTIVKGTTAPPKTPEYPEVKLDQMEVFGRLRMNKKQIADWYGMTHRQVRTMFQNQEIAQAYDRGRAEVVVAIKQKQIEVALGSTDASGKVITPPNVTMLIHAGVQFADQVRDAVVEEVEDHDPGRFSWEAELKNRFQATREALGVDTNEAEG